jgi:hypothetical protein
VYGLGGILYEALTGRPPFQGSDLYDVLERVRSQAPVAPSRHRPTPRPLETICLKCLEKEPGRRYASAQKLADDLHNYLENRPIDAIPERWPARLMRFVKKRPVVVAAPVILALVVAVTWLLAGYHPEPPTVPAADPVRQILDEFNRNGTFTFVGEKGRPGYIAWRTVTGGIAATTDKSEGFTFESHDLCLLELLPETPPDSYVFRAKVRHDEGDSLAETGIYFGLKVRPAPGGDFLGFCELGFSDCQPPEQRRCNSIEMLLRFYRPGSPVPLDCQTGELATYQPACQRPGRNLWHPLAVEVTPNRVRLFWEDCPVGDFTAANLKQHAKMTRSVFLFKRQNLPADLDFAPHGGIGLFVGGGKASFKDVVIQTEVEKR